MQNRPTLAQFARHLRTHQTDCEHLLWQKLRARQIAKKPLTLALPKRRTARRERELIELNGGATPTLDTG